MRLLIVEDNETLSEWLAKLLRGENYVVDCVYDGEAAISGVDLENYDLAMVDLSLPGIGGIEVIQNIRARGYSLPILILTAKDALQSRVEGLNAGADDYLTKPFDLGELLARAKALIRRGKGAPHPVLTVGRISLNTVEQTVRCNGQLIDLSPTEYRLFEYLIYRPRAVVSSRELLEHLYDYNWQHHSNVIEAHISNLRKKLRAAGEETSIATIRGRGYRLEAPERQL